MNNADKTYTYRAGADQGKLNSWALKLISNASDGR